jgi:hypothetical protein
LARKFASDTPDTVTPASGPPRIYSSMMPTATCTTTASEPNTTSCVIARAIDARGVVCLGLALEQSGTLP